MLDITMYPLPLLWLKSWSHAINGLMEVNSEKTRASYTMWDKSIICEGVPANPHFQGTHLLTQLAPFLKSLCLLPSFLFHPFLRHFIQSPPPRHPHANSFPALIWPTNLSWLKQISKRQIYQFKLLLSIKNQFLGYLNLWDILRFIFRQLRMIFLHKLWWQKKTIFLQMHNTILQRVK